MTQERTAAGQIVAACRLGEAYMLSGASGSQPFCNGLNCSQLCCACAVLTQFANPNRPCAELCGYLVRRGKRGAWHCLHAIPPTTYDDAVAQHRSAGARPWARHPRDLSSGPAVAATARQRRGFEFSRCPICAA
jgi:hypothetical protein